MRAQPASFFYPRPLALFPLPNFSGMALQGAAFGLLATPTQADQDFPDVPRMIGDVPAAADLLGDTPSGPPLGAIPGGARALLQQGDQRLFLSGFHPG